MSRKPIIALIALFAFSSIALASTPPGQKGYEGQPGYEGELGNHGVH